MHSQSKWRFEGSAFYYIMSKNVLYFKRSFYSYGILQNYIYFCIYLFIK